MMHLNPIEASAKLEFLHVEPLLQNFMVKLDFHLLIPNENLELRQAQFTLLEK